MSGRAKLFYGWWVVAACALGAFFSPGAIVVLSFGVFIKPLVQDFHTGRAAVSLAFTLHNLLVASGSALNGRVIDRVGNVGEQSVSFFADASGPTTAFWINGTQGSGAWFISAVQITLAFTDSGSGVDTTFVRVGSNPYQPYSAPLVLGTDGVYDVSYYARDRVGNVGGTTSVRIPIDLTLPELTVEPLPPVLTHSGVTITWTGSDATSGINGYAISVDGAAFESVGTMSAKLLVLTDGDHAIRVRATDNAGHNVTGSVVIRVDTNVFSFSGPYGGAPTIALPIVVAAIALVFLWRRSRLRRGQTRGPGL